VEKNKKNVKKHKKRDLSKKNVYYIYDLRYM